MKIAEVITTDQLKAAIANSADAVKTAGAGVALKTLPNGGGRRHWAVAALDVV